MLSPNDKQGKILSKNVNFANNYIFFMIHIYFLNISCQISKSWSIINILLKLHEFLEGDVHLGRNGIIQ